MQLEGATLTLTLTLKSLTLALTVALTLALTLALTQDGGLRRLATCGTAPA